MKRLCIALLTIVVLGIAAESFAGCPGGVCRPRKGWLIRR